jgi:threonine dehydratase
LIPDQWLEAAEQRISAHIVETPLTWDAERGIYIKWENHQITGSFKARGALNKVLSLADWERSAGLVAASAGNHGQGVALAGRLVGAAVEVFVPRHTGPAKVEAMQHLGARVHLVEGGYSEAEQAGREYAAKTGRAFVSPYNDGQVIAGQGTVALESLRQLARMTEEAGAGAAPIGCWIVPTGGAGLISGCGAVLSRLNPRPRLIGVQAAASAFAYSLYHRHTQQNVEDNPTLAEGLSGAIEDDSLTIPLLHRYVDELLLFSEAEIERAIASAWLNYGEKIEGSAAPALAAILENKVEERPAVVVITGGNIEPDVQQAIVAAHEAEAWS